MNRQALRELMEREGVDPNAYGLDGRRLNKCLILEVEEGGRCVYYAERGLRSGEEHFETEDDACESMAQSLLKDRTNRYVLVVGPLPAPDADDAFDLWLEDQGFTKSDLEPDAIRVDNPVLRPGEQVRDTGSEGPS